MTDEKVDYLVDVLASSRVGNLDSRMVVPSDDGPAAH